MKQMSKRKTPFGKCFKQKKIIKIEKLNTEYGKKKKIKEKNRIPAKLCRYEITVWTVFCWIFIHATQ